MKKATIYVLIFISFIFLLQTFIFKLNISNFRTIHLDYILKQTHINKKNIKIKKIPPLQYNLHSQILQMNPFTGRDESFKLFSLQDELNNNLLKSVPGVYSSPWTERGPNNVPGRTRAMLYDPNDPTNKRVFAGAVSGGLWVNNNIEDPNSNWQRVDIPENLAVSSIVADVNDSNIFYVGTGESYVQGRVNGNGIWKSSDGGNSWSHIFGGQTSNTIVVSDAIVQVSSPSSISGDYVAIQTSNFGLALTNISGELVLADDGSATPTYACSSVINSMAGKIGVVERGDCNFTDKVKNCQNQGAVAVIVVNSVPSFPFNMGGTDASITIPSLMMGQNDGAILLNALNNNTVINVNLFPVSSTLPSGIVLTSGKFHINDIVSRNNNGISEIYAAIGEASAGTPGSLLGGEIGLYKSVDGGNSWLKLSLPLSPGGNPMEPNSITISANNDIYVGTKNTWSFGDGGGVILKSINGTTFSVVHSISSGNRVELASSTYTNNKLYVICYTTSNNVVLLKTLDGFNSTPTNLSIPIDVNTNPVTDFTNGQGWYDLVISVDPNNDENVFIGGINTFKSTNGGNNWYKSSHGYGVASTSYVHPDIHEIMINPINSNKGLISNDGGVYFVSDWSNATTSDVIYPIDNGFNTTQFYKCAIGQDVNNEVFLAGSQDNGTQFFNNISSNINSSSMVSGGDGMFCFIDKDGQYMITSIYYNTYYKFSLSGNYLGTISNSPNEGDFVNIAELDDNLDILYSNATTIVNGAYSPKISVFKNIASSNISRMDLTDNLLTSNVTALKVSPYTTNSSTLFVGTITGKLLKVSNANTTPVWSDLTPEPYDVPFNGSISSINFGENENEILLTFHNYGVVNVFFTEDGGLTWQIKEGDLPDLPVNDVLMNPLNNNEVILATDLGVWKTSNFQDTNPHWVRSYNGMQNVKVTSFDLRTADNTVLASTYGRGLFSGTFTSALSVNNSIEEDKIIELYPTVTNGEFIISSTKNYGYKIMQIFDVNGKLVIQKGVNIDNQKVNVKLKSGVYFVKFKGIKFSSKIIIK